MMPRIGRRKLRCQSRLSSLACVATCRHDVVRVRREEFSRLCLNGESELLIDLTLLCLLSECCVLLLVDGSVLK
jgi:hypothetical protein